MAKKNKERVIRKTTRYEWKRTLTPKEETELLAEAQAYKATARRLFALCDCHKAQAKEAKDDAESAQRAAFACLDNLESGKTVEILNDCVLLLDYDAGEATYVHPATGEILHTRELTKEERQMTFDFAKEEAPKSELLPGEVIDFTPPAGEAK